MNKFKMLRKQFGLTQVDLSRKLHVNQTTVSKWETDSALPDYPTLLQLAETYRVSVDYLLGRSDIENENYADMPRSTKTGSMWIPVRGKIAGGTPLEMIEDIIDYEEIDTDTVQRGEIIALQVKGDSMAPRICNGDIVIIRVQPDVNNGEIAAITVNGDNATLKKIKKDTRGVYLVPLNPHYDTVFYSNEDVRNSPITIIGKMIELRGKF